MKYLMRPSLLARFSKKEKKRKPKIQSILGWAGLGRSSCTVHNIKPGQPMYTSRLNDRDHSPGAKINIED
jgi:hypothetical protein